METNFFRKSTFAVVWILVLIITACEYKPTGIYEADVKQITEAPPLLINLDFSSDTLYLSFDRNITFKYSANDSLVRYAYFSINDRQLGLVEQSTGLFSTSFSSADYNKNTAYTLKIEFFRSSGSNSLADKLGKEGFIYAKEITVFFEDFNGTSNIPTILSATPESGSLKITWKKFTGIGFKRYIVWSGPNQIIGIFDDPNINCCFDPNFIGYETAYQVIAETESDTYRSPLFIFKDKLPPLRLERLDDDKVLLHWEKSKYEANISGYKIIEGFEINDRILNEIAYFKPDSPNTSLVYADGKFGAKTKFFLLPIRKNSPQQITYRSDLESLGSQTDYYYFGTTLVGGLIVKTPLGDYAYFDKYSENKGYISKFNCITGQAVDSIQYESGQVSTSPDGKSLFILNSGTLKVIDTQTMTEQKSIDVSKLAKPEYNSYLYDYLISNTGLGVYLDFVGNYVFYDFKNEKELARFRIDGNTDVSDQRYISADGQFFCTRHVKGIWPSYSTDLYQLKNGTANKIWTDTGVEYFEIDQKSNSLAFLKNNKLYLMSMDNLKITGEVDIADPNFHDVDWNNREYLTLNKTRDLLSIYDLDSGKLKARKKTLSYDSYEITFQNLKLFNHTLFAPNLRTHLNY